MNIMVIGGAGFIGSHLSDVIIENCHNLLVYDNLSRGKYINKNAEFVCNDILNYDNLLLTFSKYKPDLVFHMAAQHYIPYCEKNIENAFAVNVTGTMNVLNAISMTGSVKKFFFASTGDVYAPTSYANSENDYLAPVYNYGETKLICEQIISRYKKSGHLKAKVIIGRLFNAAGSRETNPHLLPQVAKQLITGVDHISIGNTWPIRDFVDVNSMTSIIYELSMRLNNDQLVNIGSGLTISVLDAVNLLCSASEKKIEIYSDPNKCRQSDRPYLCPSVDHMINILGYACEPLNINTAKNIINGQFQY